MDSLGLNKSVHMSCSPDILIDIEIINWETKWSKCTVDPSAATLAVSKLVSSIASVKLIWTRHRLDPVQQMAALYPFIDVFLGDLITSFTCRSK